VDDETDPNRLVLEPRLLEEQIRLMQRAGYRFRTADSLVTELASGPPAGRTAVLTFDDGWLDAVTDVLPLLGRLGVPATFYVCPGWLDGQHPDVAGPAGRLMGAREVAALCAAGMEVGSHSMFHRDLRVLDDDELHADLRTSKELVEGLTGVGCRTFAYPFGFSDDRVEAAATAAGYEVGFGWSPRWATMAWKPMVAPRMPAPPRHGARRLALKLLGARRPTR